MAISTSSEWKNLLKFIVPYNLILLWRQKTQIKTETENWEDLKKQLIAEGWFKELHQKGSVPFSYEEALKFISKLDYNLDHICEGSIPENSLNYCAAFIAKHFTDKPIIGLHVGNFVGVSLAYLTNVVKQLHPESIIVSIDPNIQCRQIKNPLDTVVGLLNNFGLENNSLILTGYSLEPGKHYEPNSEKGDNNHKTSFFEKGLSCTQQLKGLEILSPECFDFFLIDGNHEGYYLKREIESASKLLKPGGLLILDDIVPFWNEVQKIYDSIDERKYQKLGTDGRVGILKKIN